ncbi:hypothetical protein AB0F17_08575 [Nonomuraea sp. NPDC026600]|uniref:hypothetical protein n=1 Tax=Nonomuraea sp. NPDC026600 TaxID=3155363 RepID=UPI0033E3DDEE
MSSIYRILCLSHDPAITVEAEYDRPETAAAAITAGVDGHARCDLLIGRYSYPLIEVGCPPTTGPQRIGQHRCYPHSAPEWVDVAWLRILAAVHQSGTERMRALARESRLGCWSWERLRRLRDELSIDLSELAGQSGEAP